MSNILTDIGTGSRGLIAPETNTCKSANTHTLHINMNENLSEFVNDDHVFNNIGIDDVVQTIENYESNVGEKNVKINSGNSSKFSILPYASIGNVTINIHSSERQTGYRLHLLKLINMTYL